MPKMTDASLRDLVVKRRDASVKHVMGELQRNRREAMQFYRGDNLSLYGDSGDGLSTVVSRDTMEAVESMLPSLVKPFVAGDEVCRFEPQGPEDEEGAKQATEYVNYLFSNHNDAFRIVYDSMKDGLLFRYGCAKVVHEEVTDSTFETYQGLDAQGLAAIEQDKSLTILDDIEQDPADGTYTVRVQTDEPQSKFRVYVIAPEEFLYEPRLTSLDEATFLAHHGEKPVGDLIAMGLDKKKCMALQSGTPDSLEDDERFRDASGGGQETLDDDDLARKVWVDDCYIRCDYDGTGTLQWRRVVMGGNDNTILLDEEANDHPFEGWTPIPTPHKLVGMSIHDLTRDIQMQKTALKREALNALYLANRPMREVVEGQVNIDDLLSPSVGGVVRVKTQGGITAIPSGGEGVMQQSMAMIEALDAEREARTGVTRYNQGLDANSLNKTATGVSIISNASMQRQELVARQYADTFLTGVFKKMLGLVCRFQDKKAVIRLRGEWVEMDPREWKTNYDMSVAVGLGTGNKDQMIAHLTNLLGVDQQIIGLQGGIDGPIVTGENLYEKLKRMVEAMGLKGVERYYTDPGKEGAQKAPEGPTPEQQATQAQQEAEQQHRAAELASQNDQHEAETAAKIRIAEIEAASREEVARIGAEKDIIVAGLTVPDNLEAEGGDQPDEAGENEYQPDSKPAMEGEEAPPMQTPPAEEGEPINPETLAALQAHFGGGDAPEQQQQPDNGVPPEIEL